MNVGDPVESERGPGRIVSEYVDDDRWVYGRKLAPVRYFVVELEDGGRFMARPDQLEPQQLKLGQ